MRTLFSVHGHTVITREEVPRGLQHRCFCLVGLRSPIVQLTIAEQELLRRCARGKAHAVELGVAEGGSARIIAEELSEDSILDLVDPFFPGKLRVVGLHEIIARRLLRDVHPIVRFHKMLSWKAPLTAHFSGVDLLFIDADHSESAVRRDWEAWSSLLTDDARVLLHDALDLETGGPGRDGPGILLRRLLTQGWRLVDQADSLAAIEKGQVKRHGTTL